MERKRSKEYSLAFRLAKGENEAIIASSTYYQILNEVAAPLGMRLKTIVSHYWNVETSLKNLKWKENVRKKTHLPLGWQKERMKQ